MAGRVIANRFEVLGTLGRGGVGVVYRARDREVAGREVALKLLRAGSAEGVRLERFQREAEVVAALDHPGLVKVFSAGFADGRPWIAFELVENARSLAEAFELQGLPERVRLVRDAARALGHAHQRGVVHRDVKPDNVLVDDDDRVRVTDFGLALGEDLGRLTQSGLVVGTPLYMAPEQLGSERERIGPATDVWGLGVVLYEALTGGELPYQASSLVEMAAAIRGRPDPPRAHDRSIPPALEAVCLRALAENPQDRYADGEALAVALDAALADGGSAGSGRRLLLGALVSLLGLASVVWLFPLEAGPAGPPLPQLPPAASSSATQQPAPSSSAARRVVIRQLAPGESFRAFRNGRRELVRLGDRLLCSFTVTTQGGDHLEVHLSDDAGLHWRKLPLPPGLAMADQANLAVNEATDMIHMVARGRGVGGEGELFHTTFQGDAWTPVEHIVMEQDEVPLAKSGKNWDLGGLVFERDGTPVLVAHLRRPLWMGYFLRRPAWGWTPPRFVAERVDHYGWDTQVCVDSEGTSHFIYRSRLPDSPHYGINHRSHHPIRHWSREVGVGDHTSNTSRLWIGSDGRLNVVFEKKGSLELATGPPFGAHTTVRAHPGYRDGNREEIMLGLSLGLRPALYVREVPLTPSRILRLSLDGGSAPTPLQDLPDLIDSFDVLDQREGRSSIFLIQVPGEAPRLELIRLTLP